MRFSGSEFHDNNSHSLNDSQWSSSGGALGLNLFNDGLAGHIFSATMECRARIEPSSIISRVDDVPDLQGCWYPLRDMKEKVWRDGSPFGSWVSIWTPDDNPNQPNRDDDPYYGPRNSPSDPATGDIFHMDNASITASKIIAPPDFDGYDCTLSYERRLILREYATVRLGGIRYTCSDYKDWHAYRKLSIAVSGTGRAVTEASDGNDIGPGHNGF